jgi:cell division protein FtsQ
MKLFKNIIIWIVLAIYLVVAMSFVYESRRKIMCTKVEIKISNSDMNKFVKNEDVSTLFEKYGFKMIGKPVDSINTFLAEQIINKNPAVSSTSAYTTIDGKMNIKVEQRNPIVRVTNKELRNYYLDRTGQLIPILKQYAAYTLIANGNISEPFEVNVSRNIFTSNKDSILRPNIIYDIFYVARYINDNDFWRTQIEQMHVNSKHEIELVPRVGSHIILFGKGDNIDIKFRKLKSMYRAFNEIGWNKYKTINLKYKDQVICTKR